LHTKAVKKLERRLQALAADHDAARQELLIKAAELLDMQAQLKESEGRQQLQEDAACEQVCPTTTAASGRVCQYCNVANSKAHSPATSP
jgi:hypothetical protein